MQLVSSLLEAPMIHGRSRPEHLRDETLVDIFHATACRLPEKIALALIGCAESLTYAELDRRSNRVAAALAARGVKPGDYVGLWFRRSLDLHVALLGILKAGAAYIPFDADAPSERVAACLADCGARLLLAHKELATETAALGVDVASIEAVLAGDRGLSVPQVPTPDTPAYAIYTSGSTGKPKGIVITHRNICHYLRAGNEALGFLEDDVVLQQASVAFDLSLEEIFVPYLVGATLKVATAELIKETDRLPEILEAEGITVIDTVPTLLSMFERDVPCLRVIVLGGETCPQALVDRFAKPGRRLLNTYGPTETTVVATYAELAPGDPVTIGRPIANHTVYVVNDQLEPVGRGRGRRAAGGRARRRAGLYQPARDDAPEIHRQPVQGRWLGPGAVSHRRCGEHRCARAPRLSRPHRRSGEDPRLSDRAGRDRDADRRRARHQDGGGRGAAARRGRRHAGRALRHQRFRLRSRAGRRARSPPSCRRTWCRRSGAPMRSCPGSHRARSIASRSQAFRWSSMRRPACRRRRAR